MHQAFTNKLLNTPGDAETEDQAPEEVYDLTVMTNALAAGATKVMENLPRIESEQSQQSESKKTKKKKSKTREKKNVDDDGEKLVAIKKRKAGAITSVNESASVGKKLKQGEKEEHSQEESAASAKGIAAELKKDGSDVKEEAVANDSDGDSGEKKLPAKSAEELARKTKGKEDGRDDDSKSGKKDNVNSDNDDDSDDDSTPKSKPFARLRRRSVGAWLPGDSDSGVDSSTRRSKRGNHQQVPVEESAEESEDGSRDSKSDDDDSGSTSQSS
jgi:hypothetical protein